MDVPLLVPDLFCAVRTLVQPPLAVNGIEVILHLAFFGGSETTMHAMQGIHMRLDMLPA